MKNYNDLLKFIMETGVDRDGRNGMTRAVFAAQMRFDLSKGFPAVTTKQLIFKGVKAELLWFLEGSGSDKRLMEILGKDPNDPDSKTIWSANANDPKWLAKKKVQFDGDLGRIYGVQWRHWKRPDGTEVDQIAKAINILKTDPYNRKNVVSAWNAGEIEDMALEPCHILFHFFVANGKVSLHMFQRSCDMFLGVPFNIASYALLLSMFAQVTGLEVGECVLTFDDAHIYHEHFDAVATQLSREPKHLPRLWLNPEIKDIDKFTMDDIKLENYVHHPVIPAKMIV